MNWYYLRTIAARVRRDNPRMTAEEVRLWSYAINAETTGQSFGFDARLSDDDEE